MSETTKTNWSERKIGSLWKRAGSTAISGEVNLNGVVTRVVVFPRKPMDDETPEQTAKRPTHVIYRSEDPNTPKVEGTTTQKKTATKTKPVAQEQPEEEVF